MKDFVRIPITPTPLTLFSVSDNEMQTMMADNIIMKIYREEPKDWPPSIVRKLADELWVVVSVELVQEDINDLN